MYKAFFFKTVPFYRKLYRGVNGAGVYVGSWSKIIRARKYRKKAVLDKHEFM